MKSLFQMAHNCMKIDTSKSAQNLAEKVSDISEPMWRHTILLCCDNPDLDSYIKKIAKDINCKVINGKKDWPDIVAIPYFIAIVDRDNVGEKYWNYYLIYYKETKGSTPVAVIDNSEFYESPQHDHIHYMDPEDGYFLQYLEKMIVNRKKKIDGLLFRLIERIVTWYEYNISIYFIRKNK